MERIRSEQAGDEKAVRRVIKAAFGEDEGHRVAGLVDMLNAVGATVVSLVAEDDGEIIGHVQLNWSWVDSPRALVDVLVLSPLSVSPARQGQGIGGDLTRAAIEAARAVDAPAVFLEGSPTYYPRLGFQRAGERGFEAPSTRIPDVAFQVYLLDTWQEWMTGRLVYCDPFWSQDCVGLRDPSAPSPESTRR